MKTWVEAAIIAVGGFLIQSVGGIDTAMVALITFMALDYLTGCLVAVRGKSKKTTCGGLSSKAGLNGLCKKGMILVIVIVAVQLDTLLGMTLIRAAAILGFAANEVLSIIENAGLMGVWIPPAIAKAVDVLKNKSSEEPKSE